jgi:hypothetical protein
VNVIIYHTVGFVHLENGGVILSGTYINHNEAYEIVPFGTIDHIDVLNKYVLCLEYSQSDGSQER